jgi:hypothetical protein
MENNTSDKQKSPSEGNVNISHSFNDLMTEEEVIQYLRVPQVSRSKNYHNVIENLKRFRDLPRIHICNKALFPKEAVDEWINGQVTNGK